MLKFRILKVIALLPLIGIGQVQKEKVISQQSHSWFALNTNIAINKHWGVLTDFQLRRSDFLDEDSFYYLRGAVAYTTENKQTIALGYGHVWYAPSNPNCVTNMNEDFVFQMYDFSSKIGNVSVLNRFRNEQRWQQVIVNDTWTGDKVFSDRVRYLVNFEIPIFKKKTLPSLVVSNEILLQFGKEIVYNTFDQNWFFVGIKQSITPKLSFDFGYMNVYQQKKSGYQYNMNHTLRLFFYYRNNANSLTHFGRHS